jgi:hypothetical protein
LQQKETGRKKEELTSRTSELSPELSSRRSSDEVTGLEVTNHVDRVRRRLSDDGSGDEGRSLGELDGDALSFGHTSDDELTGLGDDTDRVRVGRSGSVDSNEGEHESEKEGEERDSRVEAELRGKKGPRKRQQAARAHRRRRGGVDKPRCDRGPWSGSRRSWLRSSKFE